MFYYIVLIDINIVIVGDAFDSPSMISYARGSYYPGAGVKGFVFLAALEQWWWPLRQKVDAWMS